MAKTSTVRSRIRPLGDLSVEDADVAGAKAANLGELAAAGFNVPDGFVVTTEAFKRLPEIESELRAAVAALGDTPLAIRSSSVAEDLPDATFAGQYDTFLDVRGADAVIAAVQGCWDSAAGSRSAAYREVRGKQAAAMAVLVQRLVPADAAGVAYSANPVTGERGEVVINAVRGLGERLVSGEANPDEWTVRGEEAVCGREAEDAIDAGQARAIAEMARRAEAHFGTPQDIEWAIADGELFLLQSRPLAALPEVVQWTAPPGAWLRNFRLGEWLGTPVTPLFESWLLTRIEEGFTGHLERAVGARFRRPLHVVVNGWYFSGWLNDFPATTPALLGGLLLHWLPALLVRPQQAMRALPPLARFGINRDIQEWREEVLPSYRALTDSGAQRVDRIELSELVVLVDELADAAGDYFWSLMAVAGYGAKVDLPLAQFYRAQLYWRIGGSYLHLLLGLHTPAADGHAVESLDWVYPTLGERRLVLGDSEEAGARRARLDQERGAAEARARAALASDGKLLKRFEGLLAEAQRIAPLKEESTAAFTLPWPVLRRAVLRLGGHLRSRGAVRADEDVFFLTRQELEQALEAPADLAGAVTERRRAWERQRKLAPPLLLGEPPAFIKRMFSQSEDAFRTPGAAERPGIHGVASSPGRATGVARVIRSLDEADRLRAGDVLVAPATTPAWTPLFSRIAAVVTDTGGVGSHSSQIAREYGIPAVVGTQDATLRIRDGQLVTVDGAAGVVEVNP